MLRRRKVKNTMVSGAGAHTTMEFGAAQTTAWASTTPYYNNHYLMRYSAHVNL